MKDIAVSPYFGGTNQNIEGMDYMKSSSYFSMRGNIYFMNEFHYFIQDMVDDFGKKTNNLISLV